MNLSDRVAFMNKHLMFSSLDEQYFIFHDQFFLRDLRLRDV